MAKGGKLQRVVILGGGFAGLSAARTLVRSGEVGKSIEVTLVDRSLTHTYTPWLYEVCTGFLSDASSKVERDALFVSASFAFAGLPGYDMIRFRREGIKYVDPQTKTVHLTDGLSLGFDVLLVTLGSEKAYSGTPGMAEHSISLKSITDAVEIDQKIAALVKRSSAHVRGNVLIIGGGPTGVELAAELQNALLQLEKAGKLERNAIRVTLTDRHRLLSRLPESMSRAAKRRLEKLGVVVREHVAAMEARPGTVVLKDAQGVPSAHPADLCIWSGGVLPSKVAHEMPFVHNIKGRILVADTFEVQGQIGIFAAGDCAGRSSAMQREPEPQTARVAHLQGRSAALNILKFVKGEPLKKYPFRKRWDTYLAVGGAYSVMYARGFVFAGHVWFALRRLADLRYFLGILPSVYAFRRWRKNMALYAKND